MRVAVLPGDNSGCGNLRLRWPALAVQRIRPDWDITVYRPRGDVQVGLNSKGAVVYVDLDPLPDVMVLQRTGTPVLAGVVDYMQRQGVAVVTDYDDAMWCIDKDNVAWPSWNTHGTRGKKQHWRWCDYSADRADLVTVTTQGLARRYGKHGRVEVIPNGVPDEAVQAPSWRDRYPDTVTVGWAGYTATHPGDCLVSRPGAQAAVEAGAVARVIADPVNVEKDWGVPVDPVASQGGMDYYSALGCMDIMLVGLRDSPFNSCKSYLKVLEAAAAGVPSVAAATAPHRELARTFPVALARSPAEWVSETLKLVKDEGLRKEMADAVSAAIPRFTIDHRAEEWAQAWERAARRAGRL